MAGGSSRMVRAAWRALKVTPSNKRMHATRDTNAFMLCRGVGGRVMRGVRSLYSGGES